MVPAFQSAQCLNLPAICCSVYSSSPTQVQGYKDPRNHLLRFYRNPAGGGHWKIWNISKQKQVPDNNQVTNVPLVPMEAQYIRPTNPAGSRLLRTIPTGVIRRNGYPLH